MVLVSPLRHFGAGWGDTSGDTLLVTASAAGDYNVVIFGVRKDTAAVTEQAENGVEYTAEA